MSVAAGRIRIHLTHRCAQYYVGQCEQESFAHLPEFDFRRRITYFFGVTFFLLCVVDVGWGGGCFLLCSAASVLGIFCAPHFPHTHGVYMCFLCCVVVLLPDRTIPSNRRRRCCSCDSHSSHRAIFFSPLARPLCVCLGECAGGTHARTHAHAWRRPRSWAEINLAPLVAAVACE